MKKFESVIYPEMNFFLGLLSEVIEKLPNNPKPGCEGFYLTYYNSTKGTLVSEKMGEVPIEKNIKYLHFSTKKVTQTLYYGRNRSKDFQNETLEQFPGAIKLYDDCAGVSGHDSMVDEAIATLWLIVFNYVNKSVKVWSIRKEEFWIDIAQTAAVMQERIAPDNYWISVIGQLLLDALQARNYAK